MRIQPVGQIVVLICTGLSLASASSGLAATPATRPAMPATTQAAAEQNFDAIVAKLRTALAEMTGQYEQKVREAAEKKTAANAASRAKLLEGLREVQKKETQGERLGAAVEVRNVIRAIEQNQAELPISVRSALAGTLRKTFDQEIAANDTAEARAVNAAKDELSRRASRERLEAINLLRQQQKEKTSRGDLDGALIVRDQMQMIDEEARGTLLLAGRSSPLVPPPLTVSPAQRRRLSAPPAPLTANPATAPADANAPVDILPAMAGIFSAKEEGGVVLLKNDDAITSAVQYAPPVLFNIVAKLDSNNLRLKYIADKIIFNWEADNAELRVDGGPADGRHMLGAGQIPIGEWVSIDLAVEPDSMTIWVNGKPRYITYADFSQSSDVLKIFTYNAAVRIKSVTVRKP